MPENKTKYLKTRRKYNLKTKETNLHVIQTLELSTTKLPQQICLKIEEKRKHITRKLKSRK